LDLGWKGDLVLSTIVPDPPKQLDVRPARVAKRGVPSHGIWQGSLDHRQHLVMSPLPQELGVRQVLHGHDRRHLFQHGCLRVPDRSHLDNGGPNPATDNKGDPGDNGNSEILHGVERGRSATGASHPGQPHRHSACRLAPVRWTVMVRPHRHNFGMVKLSEPVI